MTHRRPDSRPKTLDEAHFGVDYVRRYPEPTQRKRERPSEIRRAFDRANSPLDALKAIAKLEAQLSHRKFAVIRIAREQEGLPWSHIARALGITRQSAQQWYESPSRKDPR